MSCARVARLMLGAVFALSCLIQARAAVFGDVRGIVFDPQSRAVTGANVTLRSRSSDFSRTRQSNANGEFFFRAIPIGEYTITVQANGFARTEKPVTVTSGNAPLLQLHMTIAPVAQRVDVVINPETRDTDSPTPMTLVGRREISETPGSDRTNSLAFITTFVPGSYVTHNQLHVRGGHQVTWLIDGVPVPNTNIADTVGAQFDPKDIDYLEVQRGSYSSEFGDRTYAVLNVVPRSGFERKREAEVVATYGNFHQTNDQFSFASHTKRFAYYGSVNGNRSDYGLQTPTALVLHDQSNGFGGFTSLIFNPNTRNQLRLATGARRDFFQVPNDEDAQTLGTRDGQREADAFVNFSWVHTFNPKLLLTVSPFYHFNRADFVGGPNDTPVSARDRRSSNYAGAQAIISVLTRRHNGKAGFFAFHQGDSDLFALRGTADDGAAISLKQTQHPGGNLEAIFAEDQFKPASWLTFTGGVRFTRFHGTLNESATSPRAGVALRIPHLNWMLHGFYGRYYQAPPLTTVSGPLLDLAIQQGFGFIPLRGERDEEHQFGLSIPVRGWMFDLDYFRTGVKNFFDHNALANSNIFFPLTIERARIRSFEVAARSPLLFGRGRFHLAYARQKIEGQGAVTGGLTDFSPPLGFFLLDHDQRETLSTGFVIDLPRRSFASTNVRYGSGFLNGEGPDHLPGHTLIDFSFGKHFGENWLLAIQTVNLANRRFLLDNSNTFGGTHFVEPRQIYLEVRHRFHY
jgi:TonB dependent receptor/Carboxypeptidase regulatory-like domain/TonB-dependent Receptor Plug Domain